MSDQTADLYESHLRAMLAPDPIKVDSTTEEVDDTEE
jgi:hypothetical protein